jgi:hypothetical protein
MEVLLTWTDISSETGYLVEREAAGTSSFAEVGKVGPDTKTYGDITTTAQSYVYRVRAYKVMGSNLIYSNYTNTVSVTTGAPAPVSSTTDTTTSSSTAISSTDTCL